MPRCPLDGHDLVPGNQRLRDNRYALTHTITIDWCPSCGLGVTRCAPTTSELGELYSACYVDDAEGEGRVPATGLAARVWHRVNGSLPLSDEALVGPVLDVGCNTGEVLEAHRRRGVDVVGLEPNPVAAARARARGLTVIQEPIETASLPPGRFRSILLSQVLEHVEQPLAVLEQVTPALAESGRIYVVVPNVESLFRSVFGVHWVHWHVPFHLWHHTARSLTLLLLAAGLRVERMRNLTPGEWLLMSMKARRNAKANVFRLEPFVGRFAARAALAPLARLADAAGRGDALYAIATRA